MRKFHVVIPMSGQGSRFRAAGYQGPKPLIPVCGTPMIQRLIETMPERWTYHFVLADNQREGALPKLLQKLRPECSLYFIGPHKEGPSFAILPFLSSIPSEDPVLVSYCDYGMTWDATRFEDFVFSSKCDSCLVSYRGFHAHYLNTQNYAFSRLEGERVVEVREKGNFTNNRENEFASCGAYYFRTRKILEESIHYQMDQKMEVSGEYYTSLTVQALIEMNSKSHVRVFEIPGFFQWGTPQDLQVYEYWERTFKSASQLVGRQPYLNEMPQILMPMAGFGSRFRPFTNIPKPLIEFNGKSMYLHALNSLPTSQKNVLVTRSEVSKRLFDSADTVVISLDHVPDGQALTAELGIKELSPDLAVTVTACDHGVVMNSEKWAALQMQKCDAVIFTVKGFPGVSRSPNSYSYVKASDNQIFPRFDMVSVKKPLTQKPNNEFLLVGTFWFKNKEILRIGIEAVKGKNIRTNNEIYLDSVFNELKVLNFDIRIFELDGYMNWGDPESLKEALYWQEIFLGHQLKPRESFPSVDFKNKV